VDGVDVAPLAVTETVVVVETEPVAGMVGSASNVTCTLKATSQLPAPLPLEPALPPPAVEPALVELCRVTSLTPSIRRRRSSVSATAA